MMKANDSVIIKQAIKNYVQRTRNVFNSNDIFRYIQQTFNVTLQKRSIIKKFKEEMNMSYRNASSRPLKASTLLNQILKLLFWIEFSSRIDSSNVFINFGEVILSRWTKFNYTWMVKGSQISHKILILQAL